MSLHQVSNFLLFQMAYTELFFVDKLWPDITQDDVLNIFKAYKTRERRCANATQHVALQIVGSMPFMSFCSSVTDARPSFGLVGRWRRSVCSRRHQGHGHAAIEEGGCFALLTLLRPIYLSRVAGVSVVCMKRCCQPIISLCLPYLSTLRYSRAVGMRWCSAQE